MSDKTFLDELLTDTVLSRRSFLKWSAALGAGVLSVFIYQNASSQDKVQVMGNLAYLAFALVLVAEIVGRWLFYASFARMGI